jgi:hypothetical protein
MARLDKPRSVQITVRDRKTRQSKTFTVYDIDVKEAVEISKRAFAKSKKEVKGR